MRISNTMSLSELAQHMGNTATEAEARAMRDELVRLRDGCETANIWADEWFAMLDRAVLTAKVEATDPALAAQLRAAEIEAGVPAGTAGRLLVAVRNVVRGEVR